jgi:hypothetical protein
MGGGALESWIALPGKYCGSSDIDYHHHQFTINYELDNPPSLSGNAWLFYVYINPPPFLFSPLSFTHITALLVLSIKVEGIEFHVSALQRLASRCTIHLSEFSLGSKAYGHKTWMIIIITITHEFNDSSSVVWRYLSELRVYKSSSFDLLPLFFYTHFKAYWPLTKKDLVIPSCLCSLKMRDAAVHGRSSARSKLSFYTYMLLRSYEI